MDFVMAGPRSGVSHRGVANEGERVHICTLSSGSQRLDVLENTEQARDTCSYPSMESRCKGSPCEFVE